MSTPSASEVVVASARLANALFQKGVPIKEQGRLINGVRCFVFERRPEYHSRFKEVLGSAYA